MNGIADRLALCEAVLALIEKKRIETGDPNLGSGIERVIVEGEFHDIEKEILEDPGAIEPWLIRRRRTDV
jgi:hypothetical protein